MMCFVDVVFIEDMSFCGVVWGGQKVGGVEIGKSFGSDHGR